jgi:lipoprotein signal peptidase
MGKDRANQTFARLKNAPLYLKTIAALVLFDAATKLTVSQVLPYQREVGDFLGSYFYLTFNKESTGYAFKQMFGGFTGSGLVMYSLVYLGLALYLHVIERVKVRLWLKAALGAAIFFTMGYFGLRIKSVSFFPISIYGASILKMISPLMLLAKIVSMLKDGPYRFGFSMILAAGIGNLLSHFYPPFIIVDFIYIPIFNRIFGSGVMNVADIASNLGVLFLCGYLPFSLAASLIGKTVGKRSLSHAKE